MVGEICRYPIRHRTWRWLGQEAAVGFRWLRLVSLVAEYIADMHFSRRKLRQYVWKYDDELFRCQVTDGTGAEKTINTWAKRPRVACGRWQCAQLSAPRKQQSIQIT